MMMPQSSQSSTLLRPKALSQEKNSTMRSNPAVSTRPQPTTHSVGLNDTRPSKRPRLSPAKRPDTNAFAVPRRYAHKGGSQSLHKVASGKDEKALLDDLMAGLDASMFENLASSPARISTSQVKPRTPLAVKHDVQVSTSRAPVRLNADVKSTKEDALPCSVKLERKNEVDKEAIVTIKTDKRKARSLSPVFVKDEPKVDIADDELYDFDFDLGDLSGLNDDELLQPQQVQIKYPLLHPPIPAPPVGYRPTPWERCKVSAVLAGLRFADGQIPDDLLLSSDDDASTSYGKTAIVKFTSSGARRVVHLKERWCDVPLKVGDIINIVSPSLSESPLEPCPAICITFKDPATYLIHHPDLMLTMTSIANAMPCPRRPLLQALVKPAAPVSKSMLYGTILHELLQAALSEQSFGGQDTRRRLKESLSKESRRLEVWGSGLGEEDVNIEVGVKAVEGFETFERKWVGPSPTSEGELHSTPDDNPSQLAITGLHDIEEDIWSPKWGLKGKVDASVQAQIVRDPTRKPGEVEEHVAPLEIKTGRSVGVMAHRAQTMLYTLLMEDRYGVPIPAGLLYYSQLDSILRVEARPIELRALIFARNELAAYLSMKRSVPKSPTETMPEDVEEAFLPPTIDDPKECRRCYSVDSCMLYRKTEEASGSREIDTIQELFEEKTGHLSKKHAEFYKKWDTLLTVEEQDMSRFRSQLWTMTAKEREKNGRCFGDMVISDYSNDAGKSLAKIHRHTYTFIRAPRRGTQAANTSLLSGHIAKGDPVSLSIEPDLLCLSRGFVTDLTPSTIVIGVTYKIDVDALLARTKHRNHAMSESGDQVVFRIDKDEMTSGMMRMRNNLAQLFFADGDEQRRRLVVDLETPQFEDARALRPEEVPASLNEDQKSAMEKVMTARDYALILGMPGTGKTTTIAEIIKALVKRGKSVLLTSYTHSAVDTILMKLVDAEFPILRLGNIDKVNPEVQHMTLEALGDSASMQQLESRLLGPPVVAATCLSIEHPLFFRRKFDYCIVDEASQITLPTCLGPLRSASTFVLVGDHFQLPPIVRHPEARRGGLDISLFRMLSEAHPEAVAQLRWQYRMNEDIMCLSNELVYEGRLQCGSDEVAHQGLILPIRSGCGGVRCESPCWVRDLLEEKVKAVFVDTDDVPGYDSKVGDLVQNATEAKLIYQLSSALVSCGIKQQDMAVITPYRQQIKVLSGLLRSMPNLEILTADKSQGRDKDVILISLVRSNESGNIGDLLKDWRRINVSFTRAKKKLVIFGSARTLRSDPLLSKFLKLMQGKGWVYKLPKGADDLHSEVGTENVLLPNDLKKVDGEIKVGKLGRKILDGKAFVRDVIADLS